MVLEADEAPWLFDGRSIDAAGFRRFAQERGEHAVIWLVADDAQEWIALDLARPQDDVVRAPQSLALLDRRRRRLEYRMIERRAEAIDELTGLRNRRAFGGQLRRVLDQVADDRVRAVVLLDLDNTKALNDTFGHAAVDALFRLAGSRIAVALGPEDFGARLGADEFAVCLVRYDISTLLRDADVLRDGLCRAEGKTFDGGEITASAGLALLRPGMTEPQVLAQADQALYEAKARGRNCLMHFELVSDDGDTGPEATLRRFEELTRLFGERMTRMVGRMGQRLVETARAEAMQDPLTGAYNRRYFNERLPREMDRARSGNRPLSMALVDVDHFHDVNASFGWPSGDAVLQQLVRAIKAEIRLVDWLARYGGEEFVLVLPDSDREAALSLAERLRVAVASATFTALDGRRIPITLSIGVAEWDAAVLDRIGFADRASAACLRAKESGRNRVVVAG
jgi:two-component system cell cycle response regulator